MEVKIEDLKKGKLKLVITLSPKEMVAYFNKAYEKIAPTIKLDGFRPGKAPRKVVEGAAGIARILSEGLDLAVSESYYEVVKDKKLIPLMQPKIVINKYPNYGSTEAEVKEGFEFEAELEILPEVKLKDYSKIEKIEKGSPEKAKADDVEKVLNHFQKQSSTLIDVERPAKNGDRVEVSFEGFLKHVKVDQMCSKNHPIILGEGSLIPGFEDQLVGLKKGDKKEFEIKFPKDYHAKEFAGQKATFKVEVNDVKEIKLPEMDDIFAEKFGHKSINELKKAVEENLNKELVENFSHDLESKVVEKMLPFLEAEIPDSLIKREIERMIGDFSAQLAAQGLNLERYLENIKKTRENLEKEMVPQAEKNIRVGLILGKIIEEKKWDQNDSEAGRKALDHLIEQLTK